MRAVAVVDRRSPWRPPDFRHDRFKFREVRNLTESVLEIFGDAQPSPVPVRELAKQNAASLAMLLGHQREMPDEKIDLLVASRLAPDAVIAYHSALQLHGKAYSLSRRITFLSQSRVKPFTFRGVEFVAVPVPSALVTLPDQGGGVAEVQRNGLAVRVTTLERTLVDVLDTPRYGGSWEERSGARWNRSSSSMSTPSPNTR